MVLSVGMSEIEKFSPFGNLDYPDIFYPDIFSPHIGSEVVKSFAARIDTCRMRPISRELGTVQLLAYLLLQSPLVCIAVSGTGIVGRIGMKRN